MSGRPSLVKSQLTKLENWFFFNWHFYLLCLLFCKSMAKPSLFLFILCLFTMDTNIVTFDFKWYKRRVCLGLKPGAAWWYIGAYKTTELWWHPSHSVSFLLCVFSHSFSMNWLSMNQCWLMVNILHAQYSHLVSHCASLFLSLSLSLSLSMS